MIPPQFVVPDVVAAPEYYRDVWGFGLLGYFVDPPVFAIVAGDSVEIQFGKADASFAELDSSPGRPRRLYLGERFDFPTEWKAYDAKVSEGRELAVYI